MLPLRDVNPTRTFPLVTVALIVANVVVWIGYQLSAYDDSIVQLGYRPCEVVGDCANVGLPWTANAFTAMFAHGSWEHLLVNMLFLWIFGNNVEDAVGRVRFLVFYLAAGIAADALQSAVTLGFAPAADAGIPNVGASGAIAGVLGGYLVLFPRAQVLTYVFPFFFFPLPAWLMIGLWFVFQLWDGGLALTHPEASSQIAYFAHIGGFLFGAAVIRLLLLRRAILRP